MSRQNLVTGMTGAALMAALNINTSDLYNAITSYSVKTFGAMGDGVTDDTNPIAATIAACVSAGGGKVFFPAGTYLTSTIDMVSKVVLFGEGNGVTILKSISNDINIISIAGCSHFGVRDMRLTGVDTTGCKGIEFETTACLFGHISNVGFQWLNNGVVISEGLVGVRFSDCDYYYNTEASLLINEAWTSELEFSHCNFEQTMGAHVDTINTGSAKGNITFSFCVFEGSPAAKALNFKPHFRRLAFYQCGWEGNGGTNVTAYDLYLGIGAANIDINLCNFSGGTVGVTSMIGVYLEGFTKDITIRNTLFSCLYDKDIALYVEKNVRGVELNTCTIGQAGAVLNDTKIIALSPITITNSSNENFSLGRTETNKFVFKRTTDATATKLFEWEGLPDKSLTFITLNVLGMSDDGGIQVAYTRKALVKFEAGVAISIIGNQDETTIESDGDLNCVIGVSDIVNGIIDCTVTGKAATNISWTGSFNYIQKAWEE